MATPFSIVTATFGLGVDGSEVDYCTSDVTLDATTEALIFQCMSSATALSFAGTEKWSGSAVLAYDDAGMDQLWGASTHLEFIVTKSTTGTVTFEGDVIIGNASGTFSLGEVPTLNITFTGDGELTEVIA